jgi:DNA-binding response OmpR family regulator
MIDILIIENDKNTALDVASVIKNWGCKVHMIIKDHAHAIHFCEHNKIDLIISETRIDDKPYGIETAYILQEIYNIPVIFTTKFTDKTTLKLAVKVNFTGYLIKPYRENDLFVLINLSIIKYHLLKHDTSTYCKYTHDIHLNKIYYDGREISLTNTERRLFLLLFYKKGNLATYEEIDEVVWADTFVSNDTRRQLLHRLKKKLPHNSIELVRGFGYKLN